MKVKMKEMALFSNCPRSYQLSKLNLVNEKGGNYHKAVAAKKLVKEFLSIDEDKREEFINEIPDRLNSSIGPEVLNSLSREIELQKLSIQLVEYLVWLTNVGAELVKGSTARDIKISQTNELIEVSCDYILKIDDAYHVVQLKTGAPHLSPQGRKTNTKVGTSFELFLLSILGVKLGYSPVIGALHHLKPRGKPKTTEYVPKSFISTAVGGFSSDIGSITEDVINGMKSGVSDCNTNECMHCNFSSLCKYKERETRTYEPLEFIEKASSDFSLTDNQRKAVLFGDGVVRVNAGAGSGKTTIVALRVTEQIIEGVFPEDILLITFTNKGAGEIREKIKYWLEKEGLEDQAEKLNIETFNSWGGKLIKEHFKELGFSGKPKLLNRVERYDIIFELLNKHPKMADLNYEHPLLNFPQAKGVVVFVSEMMDFAKSMGVDKLPSKTEHAMAIAKIYKEYNELLIERNYIEYQDQIRLINEAIDKNLSFMHQYNYQHVICDEFQDTDAGQLKLILHLTRQPKFKSLMIVGDDSQSIYGFRNTSQENILKFGKYFYNLNDIKLMENFRSTPEILEFANEINDLNKNKIDKRLISMAAEGSPRPKFVNFPDGASEIKAIASRIESDIKSGWKPEDIAFIARTRSELFEMQACLDEMSIPSLVDVPEPLLKNPLLKPLKNIMDCVDNPENSLGWADYLNITTDGFLDKDVAVARKEIEVFQKETEAMLKNLTDEESDKVKKDRFLALATEIQDEELALFVKEVYGNNETFKEIKNYIDKFIAYEDEAVYAEKSDFRQRAVTLITVHASKGKEYNVVYSSLTKYKGDGDDAARDEERRTLFVAITRAKKELTLSLAYSKFPIFLFHEITGCSTVDFN